MKAPLIPLVLHRQLVKLSRENGGNGNVTLAVDSNTLNVSGTDTGFTDTINLQGNTIAGGTVDGTTLALTSRDVIGNGTLNIAGHYTGTGKFKVGATSAGG